ncbi:N-acetylneuraminate synthase family protein [Sphingomonas sp.]|uniref:N-acetylneuraminate synthase family protein n=1 Tax=Sphingomonas sp. TaxID=28214 RepID=UPI003CC5ECEA
MIFHDLFVLELANNHWGKLDRGLKIIDDFADVVAEHGVYASIKLQFRDVDSFIHPDYRDLEESRYIKKTQQTQLPWHALRQMVDRVRARGMLTMVTPFDETSVDKAVEFGVDILKIASSDVRDKSLLRRIAASGLPVIASSGGAALEHLDELVRYFAARGTPFALNHCVSIYPSDDSELELNQIDYLRARYPDVTIGLSTHEHRDWHDSILIAYGKGARTFERHIDIDHEDVAVSPYCTLPEQAATWFKAFKKAKEMCGGPPESKRHCPDKEVRYLDALVRGVYARRDLPAGHVLTDADVFLAVPLQKGQMSTREFLGGERLLRSVKASAPVAFEGVHGRFSNDHALGRLVADRGIDVTHAAEPPRLRLAS